MTPGLRDKGLIGYWTFDYANSGSISNNQTTGLKDSSGNNNNATSSNANGTGMAWVAGKVGSGAVSFDGVDDSIIAPRLGLELTQQVSVAAWVNINSWTANLNFLGYNNSGTDGYSLQIRNVSCPAGIYLLLSSGAGTATGPANASCGSWHHVVGTYDGSQIKIYMDGVLQASNPYTSAMTYSSGYLPFGIGGDSSRIRYLNGSLDDVRVYNRALSAAEIQAIYNATK